MRETSSYGTLPGRVLSKTIVFSVSIEDWEFIGRRCLLCGNNIAKEDLINSRGLEGWDFCQGS